MQEARISINLRSISVSLHSGDWHHGGPNTKPHFVCLPEALLRIPLEEFAIPHQNPVSTTWISSHYFHLMKLRTEIAPGGEDHHAFPLLPASVTWAEINVESLIKVVFSGQTSASTAAEWDTERGAFVLARKFYFPQTFSRNRDISYMLAKRLIIIRMASQILFHGFIFLRWVN